MSRVQNSFKRIDTQRGWTIWTLSFAVLVIGFFSYIGMLLVPVYGANSNIVNAMEQSVVGQDLKRVTKRQIIKKMDDQLYLDGSHKMLNYADDVDIKRDRKKLRIAVTYDRKIKLFFNINLLVEFRPVLECDFSGRCYRAITP